MKRTISKRFELNSIEAELLRLKAKQTGISEGDYLREMILNSQPVEAPPRQFYEAMGQVNQVASVLSQLSERFYSQGYLSSEELNWFRSAYGQMVDLLVEIKRIVSSARYYASSAYEWWLHQTDLAKANGTTPSKMTEYQPRDRSNDIKSPNDPDLGWNALGITPSFLSEDAGEGNPDYDVESGSDGELSSNIEMLPGVPAPFSEKDEPNDMAAYFGEESDGDTPPERW